MKESEFQVGVIADKSGRIKIICKEDILPGFPEGLDKYIKNYLMWAEYYWNEKH